VYVDDLLLTGNDQSLINDIKERLSRTFKMKLLGPVQHFLGLQITRDPDGKWLHLSQQHYLDRIVKRFLGEHDIKSVTTPMATGSIPRSEEFESSTSSPYLALVGSLMFAAVATRPDIAATVSTLAQFSNKATDAHYNLAKRVLRYVFGTMNAGLVYVQGSCDLSLIVDASFGSDTQTRRSTSGACVFLGSNLVSWISRLQKTVSLSSCEAEYVALSEGARELLWIHQVLQDFGFESRLPVPVGIDNQAALALVFNPVLHQRTKHLDIKLHHVRDLQNQGFIATRYISTNENAADLLTKALDSTKHNKHCEALGIMSLSLNDSGAGAC
jgi:hypothetical protein